MFLAVLDLLKTSTVVFGVSDGYRGFWFNELVQCLLEIILRDLVEISNTLKLNADWWLVLIDLPDKQERI